MKYRILFRRAWRVDTGEEITPDPVLVDADWIDTTEFGVGFYRRSTEGRVLSREGVTVEMGDLIMWIPVDLIRWVREEATPAAPAIPAGRTEPVPRG